MSELPTAIEVNIEPIELYKVLKIANMVGGGGEAKIVISEGYVFVNGELETQKRKKIYHGDIIEFNGELIEVMVNAAVEPIVQSTPSPAKNKPANKVPATKSKNKIKAASQPSSEPFSAGKRKPISF